MNITAQKWDPTLTQWQTSRSTSFFLHFSGSSLLTTASHRSYKAFAMMSLLWQISVSGHLKYTHTKAGIGVINVDSVFTMFCVWNSNARAVILWRKTFPGCQMKLYQQILLINGFHLLWKTAKEYTESRMHIPVTLVFCCATNQWHGRKIVWGV